MIKLYICLNYIFLSCYPRIYIQINRNTLVIFIYCNKKEEKVWVNSSLLPSNKGFRVKHQKILIRHQEMGTGFAITAIILIIPLGRNVIDVRYKPENRISKLKLIIMNAYHKITIYIKNRTFLLCLTPLNILALIWRKNVSKQA